MFRSLLENLLKENPYMTLPHLPTDMKNRKENLENFLNKLISHQYFQKGNSFLLPKTLQEFLSSTGESDKLGNLVKKTSSYFNQAWHGVSSFIYKGQKSFESMTLIESCMKNKEKIVQLMKTNKKVIDDVEGIVKHKILNSPYNEVPEGLQRKLSAAIKSYAEFQETIQKRILWPAEDIQKDLEYNNLKLEEVIRLIAEIKKSDQLATLSSEGTKMYYQIDHLHGQASAAVEKLQINFEQIRRHYLRNTHAFWQRNLKTDKSEGKVAQKEAVSTPKEASRGPVDLGQL